MPQENKDWKEAAKLMIYSAHNLYHDGTRTTELLEELQERNLVFIQELLDKQREEFVSKLRLTNHNLDTNVGMLNFINELTETRKG